MKIEFEIGSTSLRDGVIQDQSCGSDGSLGTLYLDHLSHHY